MGMQGCNCLLLTFQKVEESLLLSVNEVDWYMLYAELESEVVVLFLLEIWSLFDGLGCGIVGCR